MGSGKGEGEESGKVRKEGGGEGGRGKGESEPLKATPMYVYICNSHNNTWFTATQTDMHSTHIVKTVVLELSLRNLEDKLLPFCIASKHPTLLVDLQHNWMTFLQTLEVCSG